MALVFVSTTPILLSFHLCLDLFYYRWLAPQFWCTCSILRRICTQVLYTSFLFLSWGFMPAYSILEGYLQKYGDNLEWKVYSRGFRTWRPKTRILEKMEAKNSKTLASIFSKTLFLFSKTHTEPLSTF